MGETLEPELTPCPACGDFENTLLGVLGELAHLRCRECGADWHVNVEELEGV